MDRENINEAIELGSWLGRKQAFSGIAGRCSAADAQCLLNMRKAKLYQASGMTWDEFCSQRVGISRSMADRTIRLLEEFGESYFYLNGIAPVSPADFRLIAGAVSGEGVQYSDEVIPIVPQNSARLTEAVEGLKHRARLALPAPARKIKDPEIVKEPEIKDPVCRATKQLQDAVGELETLLAHGPGNRDRATLFIVLGGCHRRIGQLYGSLRG